VTLPMWVELSATSADHAAWGVALGDFSWEVMPSGYVRYTEQTWPFYHVTNDDNTLRLEVGSSDEGQGGAYWRLWVNLESVAGGSLARVGAGWSLLTEPGVCWEQLRVYGPA
jgi:hypothetical protein